MSPLNKMRQFRVFFNLDFVTKLRIAYFSLAIPAIAISIRLLGFRKTRGLLAFSTKLLLKLTPAPALGHEQRTQILKEILRAMKIAIRHAPYSGNCLSRSLSLHTITQRHAIPTSLQIGTKIENGDFSAHAWVEFQDTPLNDSSNIGEIYQAFESIH